MAEQTGNDEIGEKGTKKIRNRDSTHIVPQIQVHGYSNVLGRRKQKYTEGWKRVSNQVIDRNKLFRLSLLLVAILDYIFFADVCVSGSIFYVPASTFRVRRLKSECMFYPIPFPLYLHQASGLPDRQTRRQGGVFVSKSAIFPIVGPFGRSKSRWNIITNVTVFAVQKKNIPFMCVCLGETGRKGKDKRLLR